MISESARAAAGNFLHNETQFHLGFLPTEQSNPLTREMDKKFARSSAEGVRNLLEVDFNVLQMAEKIFASIQFQTFADTMLSTLKSGKKVVFSGCGATGRLSILLESMWKQCCANSSACAPYADQVLSIMTGGDFALVRSVESFEDFQIFGKRQVQELALGQGDMLVAITEGGETSSVLGTLFEALDRKCTVFLLFNNPAELLAEKLERSRQAIRAPGVTVLDLCCGPMALAGSTRMQATTSEQLVAGAALELAARALSGSKAEDFVLNFRSVLEQLTAADAIQAMADFVDFESGVYRDHALLTYFADEFMLDIFTDTTERTPTFMLPPFVKCDDKISPPPWTFVKNPLYSTAETWNRAMLRKLRCLEWQREDYAAMHAPEKLINAPPEINRDELLKFQIGNENTAARTVTGRDAAVMLTVCNRTTPEFIQAFRQHSGAFAKTAHLSLGGNTPGDFHIPFSCPASPVDLMEHMALKLVLNTVSTGIMAKLGRVSGNWMSFVNVSNKKLLDRGIRLISELGGIPYEESCLAIFAAIEEVSRDTAPGETAPSIVQYVLNNLRR